MMRTRQNGALFFTAAMMVLASFCTGCSETKKIDPDLKEAIKSNNAAVLKVLIERGADLNTGEINTYASSGLLWKTPLMIAADAGALKTAKVLLDHGVQVDQPSYWKETALHIAVRKKRTAMVKLLVKRGADVNKVGQHGITPLLLACHDMTRKANLDIAKFLLKKGASVKARGTVRKDYDVDYEYPEDFSPLLYVTKRAYSQYEGIIPLLIKAGASVEDENSWGITPLMYASASGGGRVVSILLAHKASINAQDKDGKTPLIYAVSDASRSHQNFAIKIIQILLKNGALINERDNKGQSATQIASLKKLDKIEAFLKRKGGKL